VTAALELDEVFARRGGEPVLRDVSLSVAPGEVVGLLGPSGSGKSSLLRVLLGLLLPEQGRVRVRGEVASEAGRLHLPPEARGLAAVFQELALWPHLTVAGNLRFVLHSQGVPRSEHGDRIAAMLGQVGLAHLDRRYPGELSGGEQQRLAIARALVVQPTALLLDEPLANLDVRTKGELIELLGELLAARPVTVVHVTHDPREAQALASTIAIVENGEITYRGALEQVSSCPTAFGRALSNALRG
jgi:iron(III) transport system ATP-binding protein